MKNSFFLLNKNNVINSWLDFWDSKFLYNIYLWYFFFLKKFLNFLFAEYFSIFNIYKNIRFITGKIWIYCYSKFFILNFNIFNIKIFEKKFLKKKYFYFFKKFEW